MDISALNSATGLNFLDPEVANRATGKQTLDANDFLKLLSVQLQSQDPMKPMEDTQFISQMASFTSLEQMRGLAEDFKDFTTSQRMVTAQNYLGKIVTLTAESGDVTGEVTAITVEDGAPMLTIGSGSYPSDAVTSVKPKVAAAAGTATAEAAVTGLASGPSAASN
jgi:flagellar basal-body rod modification protein FlgD